MADAALAKKLRLAPDARAGLIDAPPGFAERLGPPPEAGDGEADFVLLFVEDRARLDARLPAATGALRDGGVFWIAYRKGGAGDLNRDRLREAAAERGWDSIGLVSLDDAWSAMRFKPL
jgi:hypothetical protein